MVMNNIIVSVRIDDDDDDDDDDAFFIVLKLRILDLLMDSNDSSLLHFMQFDNEFSGVGVEFIISDDLKLRNFIDIARAVFLSFLLCRVRVFRNTKTTPLVYCSRYIK
mmetsp:Transcript_12356/g.26289  ORF Transcript_12356/g.26289 Transcript_12356/m.26289 type:complete len:108 (+) Transcript_12356:4271-4594(+)